MSRKHCSNIYTYINAVALTSITKRRQFADHNKLLFPQSAYVTRIRTKQFQMKFSKTKYVLVKFVISEITFYGVTYIRCGKYSAMFWILLYMILRAFPFNFMNIRKIDSLQKLRRVISMMFYLSIIVCHISDKEHFDMNDISQIYKDYNMVLHMI